MANPEVRAREVLERAQTAWKRFFYPENADFVKDCGCLNSTGVPLRVADSLREVLNVVSGRELTADPTHITSLPVAALTPPAVEGLGYVPPHASLDYYRAQVVMLADALERIAGHIGTMQREGSADFHAGCAAVMKDCLPVFEQVGMQDDGDGYGFDRAADETINNASACWGFGRAMRRLTPAQECTASPFGRHQVGTSMESGPNNCFFCSQRMGEK